MNAGFFPSFFFFFFSHCCCYCYGFALQHQHSSHIFKELRCENSFYKYHHRTEYNMFRYFFFARVSSPQNISFHSDFPWIFIHFSTLSLFVSFGVCLCCIVRISIVFGCPAVAREKKVPKTFPRCNICHVLYPVNWRFSPLSQNRFAFFSRIRYESACLHGFAYCHCYCFLVQFSLSLCAVLGVPYENLFIYMKIT